MVDVSSQNGNASIKVSSSGVTSSINATPDMALYYSEKSREYSESAKKYADEGKGYLDSAVIIYNDFDNQSSLTLREIATVKSGALEELNVALNEGKDVALGAITDEKTVALNAIENEKDVAIQEIDDAFAELGEDLSDVKIVADNIETVQTIGENIENILNKTVDVGDTLTSEAGTEAKVVNVGTKFAPVLEFTIPQGAKGVDGKDGKDGADGGMNAEFDSETATLSFSAPRGVALYPEWGYVQGDINNQVDLKTVLDGKQNKGDYALKSEIPDISGLATKEEIPDTSNLATKDEIPNISNLATKDDIPDVSNLATRDEIPSLDGYVKNTDFAKSDTAGVVKVNSAVATVINAKGIFYASTRRLDQYKSDSTTNPNAFISKGTLENIKDDYVKRGLTENDIELTADEKASAKQWLGYADNTDIMTAIASIPQFSLSIVDELPLAGEKMTLYLVPKEGTNNDVYDEYIWIEQTSSFEHLGTTAVDLTDYVKNTDYATETVGGVVKISDNYFGLAFNSSKQLYINKALDTDITNKASHYKPIVPSNLDLAVKTGVTTNTIELTDDEKSSARTWLGAVGDTDYATATKAGILTPSGYYGTDMSGQYLYTQTKTLDQYKEGVNGMFVGKGTLENVLTQYSKTVLTTEADYNALETKDANTLYLIEE